MNREARWLEQRFLSIMAKRRASGLQGNDALTALLRYPMMDGSPAGDQELVGHVATLFLVAYETTGNTLAWTFYLLAQHPEAQHELLDELAPFHDDSPSIHQLDLLPVLDRIVKESVRILPAVPYNRWRVARDDAIGRYFLPAQTSVFFSIYATHHMNEIYAQPERFLPDRWLTIHPAPGEYLPYGLGHRMCLGTSLAQLIVKTVLSIVVPAWRVQVVPNARIDRQQGISLGPRHGLPVRVWKQDRRLEASRVRGNILEMVEPAPPAKTTKRVAA
jgi:cytochrome P450